MTKLNKMRKSHATLWEACCGATAWDLVGLQDCATITAASHHFRMMNSTQPLLLTHASPLHREMLHLSHRAKANSAGLWAQTSH